MNKKIYKVASDLGYSSMKMSINGKSEIIDSVIVETKPNDRLHKVPLNQQNYFDHLEDHMDVSITSDAVKKPVRVLVGKEAQNSGLRTKIFNVSSSKKKSEQDLSMILTLSRIATEVVKDAKKNDEDLSEILKADVVLTTSLPIKEGKDEEILNNYKNKFEKGKHLVNFQAFESTITVELKFKKVFVGLEGEVAQFAIINADEDLKKKIKKDYEKTYPKLSKDLSVDELIKGSTDALGIDIGEGTTDFSVIIGGHSKPDASSSVKVGYGNVLDRSIQVLSDETNGSGYKNREQLNVLLNDDSPLTKNRREHVQEKVNEQLDEIIDEITEQLSFILGTQGTIFKVIYVYGGGSIPLSENGDLRSKLEDTISDFIPDNEVDIPVIFIDKSRARTLNEDGLVMALNQLIKNQ